MRLICRVVAVVTTAVLAGWMASGGAARADQQWTEWRPADAGGRIIPYDAAALGATVHQSQIVHNGTIREVWEWTDGGLIFAQKMGFGRYVRGDFDAATFQEMMGRWQPVTQLGIRIDPAAVRQAENGLGPVFYAVQDDAGGKVTCFLFMQAFPTRAPAGHRDISNGVGGYIFGKDCRARGAGVGDALVEAMLAHIGA